MGNDWPTCDLFGIPVRALTMDQVLSIVGETITARERLLIGVVNAAKVVNMRRDESLGRAVLDADMILADGISVVWASRLLKRRLPERVPGIDLMLGMLEQGSRHGHRVYCLGATDDVLSEAVGAIVEKFPGAVVAGFHHGYFRPEDEPQIVADIRAARADILFVAMSSPRKEEFLARWYGELGVPVCHGVGGSFDVLAGKVHRAPLVWQKLGLEWLYRVLQEPRRMWRRYLVTNTWFCYLLLSELLSRPGKRRTQPGRQLKIEN